MPDGSPSANNQTVSKKQDRILLGVMTRAFRQGVIRQHVNSIGPTLSFDSSCIPAAPFTQNLHVGLAAMQLSCPPV